MNIQPGSIQAFLVITGLFTLLGAGILVVLMAAAGIPPFDDRRDSNQ